LRADPLVFSAIHAFQKIQGSVDPLKTACIALVSSNWGTHVGKVLEASREKRIKPGNFTRMGPHTVATYLATALGFHGPTFALLDGTLANSMEIGESLLVAGIVSDVCVILVEQNQCTVTLFSQ